MNLSELLHLGKVIRLASGEAAMVRSTDELQIAFLLSSGVFHVDINGFCFAMPQITDVEKATALAKAITGAG